METVINIQKAIDYIEENIFDELKFDVIASQAYMSVYSYKIVPMFRRNGYRCSGRTIPLDRNREYR